MTKASREETLVEVSTLNKYLRDQKENILIIPSMARDNGSRLPKSCPTLDNELCTNTQGYERRSFECQKMYLHSQGSNVRWGCKFYNILSLQVDKFILSGISMFRPPKEQMGCIDLTEIYDKLCKHNKEDIVENLSKIISKYYDERLFEINF